MNRFAFLFFFSCSFLTAFSQNSVAPKASHRFDSLLKVADDLLASSKLEEALVMNSACSEEAIKMFGEKSEQFAKVQYQKGVLHMRNSQFALAEEYQLRALQIRKEILSEDHLDYLGSLTTIGYLSTMTSKYKEAESYLLEAKDKAGNKEENFELLANVHNNLGILYKNLGKSNTAEEHYLKSMKFAKDLRGEQGKRIHFRALDNLSVLYKNQGLYDKARATREKVSDFFKSTFGENSIEYASSLSSLGIILKNLGDYENAESTFLKSLALKKRIFGGEDNYKVSLDYLNLGNVYKNIGNYQKAEENYVKSLKILEIVLGKEKAFYGRALNNLGLLYVIMHKYEQAEPIFLDALTVLRNTVGEQNLAYMQVLVNLGKLYHRMGKFPQATNYLSRALSKAEQVLGKDHRFYAQCLDLQGRIDYSAKNYVSAKANFNHAVSNITNAMGNKDFAYTEISSRLANTCWKLGEFDSLQWILLENNQAHRSYLAKATRHLSEKELSQSLPLLLDNQTKILSLAHDRIMSPDICYDNALFYKGFLLSSSNRARTLAQQSPENRKLYAQLQHTQRKLFSQYARPIQRQQNVEQLQSEVNTLEKEIAKQVSGYGEAIKQITWRDIRDALHPKEMAIEFVHFPYQRPESTDSILYSALIVQPNAAPKMIHLFEEEELRSLLSKDILQQQEFIANLYGRKSANRKNRGELHELIWAPLEKYMKGNDRIYISPSGLLHRINLGAIRRGSKQTINDKYEIFTLTSTRQITEQSFEARKQFIDPADSFVAQVYGGINYDRDTNEMKETIPLELPSDKQLSFSFLKRSSPSRGQDWTYLPGTKEEAQKVSNIITKVQGTVKLFMGLDATEESIKSMGSLSNAPKVLHLATHGYFNPDPDPEAKTSRFAMELPAFKISEHPMIRSGLIMAGGNQAWLGQSVPKNMEDGILTAYEVSQLNLSNTQLVVLSACETGLGDIRGNEGVYGLQRAFKIAGAKSLIMSLWTVPDLQTKEFMILLYDNWLNKQMSLSKAFKSTQEGIRKKYPEHYYWAAFVLIE